jgi:2-polyprenyl-3-methyl-5-hydroxy-6-metoxy-1,4-benzoquinol methylase
LDILPIIFHGTGDTIKKDELWVRNGSLTVKILPRIKANDLSYGLNYSERSKAICKYFRCEYDIMKKENEKTNYFKDKLINNYIYKEVILEWYLRIKLMIENNYSQIISLVPPDSSVVDIGCGYGFLSYMLNFTSDKRTIIGIDYDKRKIDIANNCFSKNSSINFFWDDITNTQLPKSDVFILFDVLHYLKREEQEKILSRCVNNLNENGIIIIRDANENRKNKHMATRLGELFSTGLGFNKLKNEHLYFFPDDFIYEIGKNNQLDVKIQKHSKITSNQMFVLKKKTTVSSF